MCDEKRHEANVISITFLWEVYRPEEDQIKAVNWENRMEMVEINLENQPLVYNNSCYWVGIYGRTCWLCRALSKIKKGLMKDYEEQTSVEFSFNFKLGMKRNDWAINFENRHFILNFNIDNEDDTYS